MGLKRVRHDKEHTHRVIKDDGEKRSTQASFGIYKKTYFSYFPLFFSLLVLGLGYFYDTIQRIE